MGQDGLVAVEIFAAKGAAGAHADVFMAVSCRCGLFEADALRIDGRSMVAVQQKSIMPIDFPPLSESMRETLVAWAKTGQRLPVAEFAARGVFDAYFLDVVVAS